MEHPEPPKPLDVGRGIEFSPLQAVGLALIFAIPLLALLGVFGNTTAQAGASQAELSAQLRYPSRLRYQTVSVAYLVVRNESSQDITDVTVGFDRDYVEAFKDVRFTPDVDQVTGEAYQVHLSDIPPGKSRLVTLEGKAIRYWLLRGAVTIAAPHGEPLELDFRTFVFP